MSCEYLVTDGPGSVRPCGRAAKFVMNSWRPVCARHTAVALQSMTEKGETVRVEAAK